MVIFLNFRTSKKNFCNDIKIPTEKFYNEEIFDMKDTDTLINQQFNL